MDLDPQRSAPCIGDLADRVERLLHLFIRARQQMLDRARHDVDWSARLLIGAVVKHGPLRIKELAEQVESDPSTVSRHVGHLVRDGFLERRADAEDGRASLLTATEKARQAVAQHRLRRDLHYEHMMHAWDDHDRAQLADLLGRFTEDFETYKTALGENDWTSVRPASREETTS